MRLDEEGKPCPATLGEYRDLVFALVRDEANHAVAYLDGLIEQQGRDEQVIAHDSQMRQLLYLMMLEGLQEMEPLSYRQYRELAQKAKDKGCLLVPVAIPNALVAKVNEATARAYDAISGDDIVVTALERYFKAENV